MREEGPVTVVHNCADVSRVCEAEALLPSGCAPVALLLLGQQSSDPRKQMQTEEGQRQGRACPLKDMCGV